jgi:putative ABC transport system ATP-binding protein
MATAAVGARRGAGIVARGLTHAYPGIDGANVQVLSSLDLTLDAGERVAIAGRSGAGKSTLLALLGGLERLQGGELQIAGADVGQLQDDGLATFRRETVGFVFQHFGLLDSLSAIENVELAMIMAAIPRATRRHRAQDLLDQVGVGDRAGHLPGALSGGERQRVAIARAVANDPQLLLADEPTGNLDEETATVVLDMLDALTIDRGCTFVVVTHDETVSSRADRRLVLEHGSLFGA